MPASTKLDLLRSAAIQPGSRRAFGGRGCLCNSRKEGLILLDWYFQCCRATKLADIYEAAKNDERAEQLLEELADRNRDDEGLAARLEAVRIRNGKPPKPESQGEPSQKPEAISGQTHPEHEAASTSPVPEEALDPETRHYVAQALTDVDLFSSYGLTQKAANLLESVLQRAPRHTPTLERLLDLSVGAGNDQRTAQLAETLEQIHRERNDKANAEPVRRTPQEISDRRGPGGRSAANAGRRECSSGLLRSPSRGTSLGRRSSRGYAA